TASAAPPLSLMSLGMTGAGVPIPVPPAPSPPTPKGSFTPPLPASPDGTPPVPFAPGTGPMYPTQAVTIRDATPAIRRSGRCEAHPFVGRERGGVLGFAGREVAVAFEAENAAVDGRADRSIAVRLIQHAHLERLDRGGDRRRGQIDEHTNERVRCRHGDLTAQ